MPSTITLKPEREKSLLRHHPWIFDGAIEPHKNRIHNGDTVDVFSSEGKWLGRGAWSQHSQIKVRMWTFRKNENIDNAFFLRRIERALQQRRDLLPKSTTGYRLVAAESDGLPGVTIDMYGNVAVCQLLSTGAERHRSKIVWALRKLFPDICIHERSDVAVRKKEGLKLVTQTLHGEIPQEIVIQENDIKLYVNVMDGHKTGFYLDQRDSRQFVGSMCEQKNVLNCFSYTGAFSCYALANRASHVTSVDVSDLAIETAQRNIQLNNLDESKATFIQKDVFKVLRTMQSEHKTFDHIILDPPKFVDSKATINSGCRGYKDINLQAFKLLKSGGVLSTFSCSGLVSAELFQKVVADAALDAGKDIQIIKRLEQSADHPVATNYPEGFYLKGLVCRVL
jgi:23S rRNA (cytosine1962-C5)-methyltransferase